MFRPGAPSSRGDRLRVLQATPVFEPSVGGVEIAVKQVASRLAARDDVTVEVLTTDATKGRLPSHQVVAGVPVNRVPAWPRGGDQMIAPGAFGRVARGGWDVVHVQCYHTFFSPAAMAAAARAGIPYVLTFHAGGHSSRLRTALRGTQLRTLKPLFARAAALIATADWEVDHYSRSLDLPRGRFVVIPNGADLPAAPERKAAGEGTLIVSMGRLERYKGHQLAIAALPELLREVPDARLWVAGVGPYEPELRALARRLGVAGRVEIRAERDRVAYTAALAGASVAVLLSEFETHPIAALEAANLGVPVLVSGDRPGTEELARTGVALGVAHGAGAKRHAGAMLRLIREPPGRPVMEMASWEDCVDDLMALYSAVA